LLLLLLFPVVWCICHPAASPRVHVLTAYATGSGAPSRESTDPGVRNGYFTGALLHHLADSGRSLDVRKVLKRVSEAVEEAVRAAVGGVQVPEIRNGLPAGSVFMVPTATGARGAVAAP
jgi:hypothetical protein